MAPSRGPKVACEITADRVIAARVGHAGQLSMHSVRRLATNAVTPGLTTHNVAQPEALRDAIAGALRGLGDGSRDVIVVLPDATVRILLLDFDALPEDPAESDPIIRFRVKKSLPFDVEQAALSYQVQRGASPLRVIAALSPRSITTEYEDAVRAAGYQPGIVLPSVLATLGLVPADRPTMVVKLDGHTTTLAIVDGNELVLLRTLDHPHRAQPTAEEVAANIHPSLVFFEDTYGRKVELLLLTGVMDVSGLAAALQQEAGVPVRELSENAPTLGEALGERVPDSSLMAVAGALA